VKGASGRRGLNPMDNAASDIAIRVVVDDLKRNAHADHANEEIAQVATISANATSDATAPEAMS